MIKGVHIMFYCSEPEALRQFFRDKLGFSSTDVGEGRLIFDLPEVDLGVHPVEKGGKIGPPSSTPSISFYCDDIQKTLETPKSRGVEFTDDITDRDYGLAIHSKLPGNFEVELYQALYKKNPKNYRDSQR